MSNDSEANSDTRVGKRTRKLHCNDGVKKKRWRREKRPRRLHRHASPNGLLLFVPIRPRDRQGPPVWRFKGTSQPGESGKHKRRLKLLRVEGERHLQQWLPTTPPTKPSGPRNRDTYHLRSVGTLLHLVDELMVHHHQAIGTRA